MELGVDYLGGGMVGGVEHVLGGVGIARYRGEGGLRSGGGLVLLATLDVWYTRKDGPS